jgi:cytidylate kinase
MTRASPVIAIDGPVGAGKSTAARALARALGYTYLNTGAMYRAVAIAARDAGVTADAPGLEARLAPLLAAIRIEFSGERLLLGGRDVSAQASEPEIGDLASRLSALGAVRARMRELQRAAGERGGVVMEGRDIGTVVFPDAEFKFYLDADVMERARRRHAELLKLGSAFSLEEVAAQLRERDGRDSGRELAPLRAAPDAVVIDSTGLSLERVVDAMKTRIMARINDRKGLKRT